MGAALQSLGTMIRLPVVTAALAAFAASPPAAETVRCAPAT